MLVETVATTATHDATTITVTVAVISKHSFQEPHLARKLSSQIAKFAIEVVLSFFYSFSSYQEPAIEFMIKVLSAKRVAKMLLDVKLEASLAEMYFAFKNVV